MLVQIDVDVPEFDTVLAAITIRLQPDGKLIVQAHGDTPIGSTALNLIRELADVIELEELLSGM